MKGALACLLATALAAVVVPAMHAEEHAREAEADRATRRPTAPPADGKPIIRVTHAISTEIEGGAGATPHAHHHHHHHDGDRPGRHGADAPEHFSFALAAAAPQLLPPPFVAVVALDPIRAPAPLDGAIPLHAWRNRGPPD